MIVRKVRWWISVRLLEAALLACPWPRIRCELGAVLEAWAKTALAQAADNPDASANLRISRSWRKGPKRDHDQDAVTLPPIWGDDSNLKMGPDKP